MRLAVTALAFLALALASDTARADAPKAKADAIVGEWLTANGEARIRFAFENGAYVGRISWLKTATKDGKPIVDENNPDPALRSRTMMGAAIVWNLHFDGSGYVDGYLYDPEHGKTYKGKATVESPTRLALRGYVGIPLFGRSETWTRVS
ncbi:MAG: DUF2147 domain-containing protein [Labilithrix sp.]|nr:DUF2147 domain-containing protein [Labilithrix sp.]MCW5812954.1 DUF2147 domain-containing protein [Labilithrix sp.]